MKLRHRLAAVLGVAAFALVGVASVATAANADSGTGTSVVASKCKDNDCRH